MPAVSAAATPSRSVRAGRRWRSPAILLTIPSTSSRRGCGRRVRSARTSSSSRLQIPILALPPPGRLRLYPPIPGQTGKPLRAGGGDDVGNQGGVERIEAEGLLDRRGLLAAAGGAD